jgi:hypothetical protein
MRVDEMKRRDVRGGRALANIRKELSRLGRRLATWDAAMDRMSPARRVRRAFARIGVLVSVFAFIILGLGDLTEQWIGGHASARFMLGTMSINAGICLGVFAVIGAVGCALSFALGDDFDPGAYAPADRPPRMSSTPEEV